MTTFVLLGGVLTIVPSSVLQATYLVRSHDFVNLRDVASDATGFSIVVCNADDHNSLSIFEPSGQVIHTIRLKHPWVVARAPNGSVLVRVWVTTWYCNKLWKL